MSIFLLFLIYFSTLSGIDEAAPISEEIEYQEQYERDEFVASLNKDRIIYIQTCSVNDLTEDALLSEEDAIRLLTYREKYGIKDWQDIIKSGISSEYFSKLKEVIVFSPRKEWYKEEIIYRIQHTRENYYLRSDSNIQKEFWTASLCTEKDYTDQSLIDHISFSLSYKNEHPQKPFLSEISLGHYSLQSGKGIVFGQNQYRSKSSIESFRNISKASNLESKYLNGVNGLFQFKGFYLLSFYSSEQLYLTLDSLNQIVKINQSGLNKSKSFDQDHLMTYGAILEKRMSKFITGIQYYFQEYPFAFSDTTKSQKNQCWSHYMKVLFRNIRFEYEWAKGNGQNAFITSILIKGELDHELQYRYYEQYFPSLYGNPYSHKSSFPNEKGISYTLTFKIKSMKFSLLTDQYQYLEAIGNNNFIQNGSENRLSIERKISKDIINAYLNYRISDAVLEDTETEKKKLSLSFAYRLQDDKRTTCQYQVIYSKEKYDEFKKKHQGLTFIQHYFLYFQDLRFKFSGILYQNDDIRYLSEPLLGNNAETMVLKESGFQISCQMKVNISKSVIVSSQGFLQKDADRKWGLSTRMQMIF